MADTVINTNSNNYKAGVTATKVGTATAAQVLTGKTFTNSSGVGISGTMTNNGTWTNTPTTKGKVTIPAGYHNGSGYVDTTSVYNAGVNSGKVSDTVTYSIITKSTNNNPAIVTIKRTDRHGTTTTDVRHDQASYNDGMIQLTYELLKWNLYTPGVTSNGSSISNTAWEYTQSVNYTIVFNNIAT